MRIRTLGYATAAALAATLLPGAPATGQTQPTISVTPVDPHPGESVTVTGTSDCASVAYTVTLSYTDTDAVRTATATGTTDASGEFSQAITVPIDAEAFAPTTVTASVECAAGPATSNVVDLSVQAFAGSFTATPAEGRPGTVVTLSGTNCVGSGPEAVFGDGESFDLALAVTDLTAGPDGTFTGSFTIPEGIEAGDYVFAAACSGTRYEFAPFEVLAAVVAPPVTPPAPPVAPPAPPARPVPATPRYNG